MDTLRSSTAARNEVVGYIDARLKTLRNQLEAADCTDDASRVLRGRIAELKLLHESIINGATHE